MKDCDNCKHSVKATGILCPKVCKGEYTAWEAIEPKQSSGLAINQKHYQVGEKQPIEIMQAYLSSEQFNGWLKANVIKYVLRIGHKSNDREDAGKLSQYAKWLCQAMDGEKINPRSEE